MNDRPETEAIQARGIRRTFGAIEALAGLDLDIRRGEMFGLVGPDGAGKSTAIRLLCGILRPSAGSGRVLGFDLVRESEAIKRRIGYLSQEFTLYGDLTVDENIEFFARIHGVLGYALRRDELLAFTRLTPFRTRLAQSLSGGMKKKLALACTLIHTPELIFLDEPSTGVDPVSRGEFWNILSGILEQGVTIMMTTPYLDEADRCTRVGLMHRGRIVRCGTPAEVKASLPGKVYRIECANPSAVARALRARLPAVRSVVYGGHLDFWAPDGEAGRQAAVQALAASGLGPVATRPIPPSMEDVFVALLGGESA